MVSEASSSHAHLCVSYEHHTATCRHVAVLANRLRARRVSQCSLWDAGGSSGRGGSSTGADNRPAASSCHSLARDTGCSPELTLKIKA